MLQAPHLPGQSETTPGSIGQKYSVSDEIAWARASSARADLVSRLHRSRIASHRPTTRKVTARTATNRSRTCTARRTSPAASRRAGGLGLGLGGASGVGVM